MTDLIAIMTKLKDIDNRVLPIIRTVGKGERAGPDTPIDQENEEMGITAYLFEDDKQADIVLSALNTIDWDNTWAVRCRTPEEEGDAVIVNLIRYGVGSPDLPITLYDLRNERSQDIYFDEEGINIVQPLYRGSIPIIDID